MSLLLKCEDVTKKYGKKIAIDNLSLELESGHIVGLLGPNGSGKTTFIKLLNGLLTPENGRILIKDKPVGLESKRIISYLPDQSYLNPGEKITDIISFFKEFYDDFKEEKALAMTPIVKNTRQTFPIIPFSTIPESRSSPFSGTGTPVF